MSKNFFNLHVLSLDRATSSDCYKIELTSMKRMTRILLNDFNKTIEELPAKPLLIINTFDNRNAKIHALL